MSEPTYKPNQWIIYEHKHEDETTAGFGQIIGGVGYDGGWKYLVAGTTADGENVKVAQEDITHILENGNWTAPQHFGGSNSAYADTAPSA